LASDPIEPAVAKCPFPYQRLYQQGVTSEHAEHGAFDHGLPLLLGCCIVWGASLSATPGFHWSSDLMRMGSHVLAFIIALGVLLSFSITPRAAA
jgi:hypothetical protein